MSAPVDGMACAKKIQDSRIVLNQALRRIHEFTNFRGAGSGYGCRAAKRRATLDPALRLLGLSGVSCGPRASGPCNQAPRIRVSKSRATFEENRSIHEATPGVACASPRTWRFPFFMGSRLFREIASLSNDFNHLPDFSRRLRESFAKVASPMKRILAMPPGRRPEKTGDPRKSASTADSPVSSSRWTAFCGVLARPREPSRETPIRRHFGRASTMRGARRHQGKTTKTASVRSSSANKKASLVSLRGLICNMAKNATIVKEIRYARLAQVRAIFSSSERSVAGAGVRLSAAISARNSGVILTSTAASESLSCSTLRAPTIGAVTAGWAPT